MSVIDIIAKIRTIQIAFEYKPRDFTRQLQKLRIDVAIIDELTLKYSCVVGTHPVCEIILD